MRAHISFMPLSALLLASCGGGGESAATPVTIPTPTPAAAAPPVTVPTPTPAQSGKPATVAFGYTLAPAASR